MSEFAMVWNLDGAPADQTMVARMAARLGLAHADAIAARAFGALGVCHAALWLDPDSPDVSQPLVDQETGCVIVASARIDNRAELVAALDGTNGEVVRRIDDTVLLLEAWKRWGKSMVDRLLGDFAFAIFDPRQQLVFAARDPLGATPLVQHFVAGKLMAIATSVRPLLACPAIPSTFDESRIVDYLMLATGGNDPASTYYQAIRRIPPGHCMIATAHKMELGRYFDRRCEIDPDGRHGDGHYAEQLRELLHRSVSDRLRPGWRMGSMLSGGLDSNSVAAIAGRLLRERGERLITFSGTSVRPDEANEMEGVRLGQSNPDFDARSLVRQDVLALGPSLGAFIDDVDEPFDFCHGIAIPLYSAARAAGVRGVFDGMDADSLFSFEDYITRLWRGGSWVRATRESIAVGRFMRFTPRDAVQYFWSELRPALVPWALRRWVHGRVRSDGSRSRANQKLARIWNINPDLAQRFDVSDRHWQDQPDVGSGSVAVQEGVRRVQPHPFTLEAIETLHRTGRAAGIMPMHPFFDVRLFEFAARLPHAQRLRNGWLKWTLRMAMDGIVPPELVWRRGKDHVGEAFQAEFLRARMPRLASDMETARPWLEPYVDIDRTLPILQRRVDSGPTGPHMTCESQVARIHQLARWLTRRATDRETRQANDRDSPDIDNREQVLRESQTLG